MRKAKTICVVAGSFDPITLGHGHLIREAACMFDEMHVVVGVNPTKKYLFSAEERLTLVSDVVRSMEIKDMPVHFHYLKDKLLIQLAGEVGATHLVRGIRSTEDFNYETSMALVNRKINPFIGTVYLVPPPELSEVSSSTVKGLVGFEGWESIVSQYVHPLVLDALKRKHLETK
jgi:pantetheine-phosphate adenylyltransferase